jgi:V8-like Glu-specific endopeptidase
MTTVYDAKRKIVKDGRAARGARYPATGHFSDSVACTLIQPRWAITAAHVAEEQQPFADYYVTFNGQRYGVEKIIIHPRRVVGTVD